METNLQSRVIDAISNASIDNDSYSITYKYIDGPAVDENASTLTTDINVLIEVKNKNTGSSTRQVLKLLVYPVETENGLKINGIYYSPLNIDKRSTGWYIGDKAISGVKRLRMELIPDKGMKIRSYDAYGEIAVILGMDTNRKVNLGVFLKALTGKSISEIGIKLGRRNQYIASTMVEEISRDDCIDRVLSSLLGDVSSIPGEFRYNELRRRFYDKNYLNCESSIPRTKEKVLFVNRALYKELALDLTYYIDGHKNFLPKGTKLTTDKLNEIDNSDTDTLVVYHDNRLFELKKYKIPDGSSLSDEELFTMFNMFACALSGYPSSDRDYELSNRRTITFNDEIIEKVKSRIDSINDAISNQYLKTGEETDFSNVELKTYDPCQFINSLKSENKFAEVADTTNWLSSVSKSGKIVQDFSGRGNSEMRAVKDTELGFYDPYVQPESSNVGLVHQQALAVKNENGQLSTPCVPLIDGNPKTYTDNSDGHSIGEFVVEWLTPTKRYNSKVIPWDAKIEEDVSCYYKGLVITEKLSKVDYQEYSPLNNLSLQTAIIPLMDFSCGKRVTMGGNHSKQAQTTIKTSRPIVSTGVASLYAKDALLTARSILTEHYVNNKSLLPPDLSLEEFSSRPIKLVMTDMRKSGYRDLAFEILGDKIEDFGMDFVKTIPYCQRTTTNSVTQMNIRSSKNFTYQGDEVVAYPNSFDIDEYDVDAHINLGYHTMTADTSKINDLDLALGNSYLVAYKSVSSLTMDDSLVISSELLGSNMLARIVLKDVKYTLKSSDKFKEDFRCLSNDEKFSQDGLPKIGTIIKPQESFIHLTVEENIGGDFQIKNSFQRTNSTTEGVVIGARIVKNTAVVTLASFQEIGVGDKLTGNHGNKSTIGKIIPKSNMPVLEDGRTLQVCINPLGLPSRMNVSQLKECVLAYAMYKKSQITGKKCSLVISPQNPDSNEICNDIIKEYDVHPEYLYDGRTGKRFPRKATVGYLYLKALYHTADSMFNSTGITSKVNPSTLQPVRGKKREGGQSEGEMETWALASTGMFKTLQEHMSIQSDDVKSDKLLKNYLRDPSSVRLTGFTNHNNDYLLAYLRSLGCDIINGDTSNYVIQYMTDKDICALSPRPLEAGERSLDDSTIFGSVGDPEQIADARTRWGYISLGCKIINPNWIYNGNLPKLIIVNKVKEDEGSFKVVQEPMTSENLKSVILNEKNYGGFIALVNGQVYFTKNISLMPKEKWRYGMSAVIDAFEYSSLETAYTFYSNIADDEDKSEKDRFEAATVLNTVKDFQGRGLDLKDLPTSFYPIMPKPFRLSTPDRTADADWHYRGIIKVIANRKDLDDRATELFKRLCSFIGIGQSDRKSSNNTVKNLKSIFAEKSGMRSTILSKTLKLSSRGVIVPAEAGVIKLGEFGKPFKSIVTVYEESLIPIILNDNEFIELKLCYAGSPDKNFMKNFMVSVANQDPKFLMNNVGLSFEDAEEKLSKIRRLVEKFSKTLVEDLGRQPTLHRYGIRAQVPVVFYDKAMHLHPLLGSAYNADYDGDQMHSEALLSDEAKREGLTKMSPKVDLLNPKDGSFVLEPTQDILLGSYLATMLYNNCESIEECSIDREGEIIFPYLSLEYVSFYSNLNSIKSDIEANSIDLQSLVCFKHESGRHYLSTAGRILFNSCFDGGFTDEEFSNPLRLPFVKDLSFFSDLKFDGLIRKKGDDYTTARGKVKDPNFTGLIDYSMSSVTLFLCRNLIKCNDQLQEGEKICNEIDNIFIFGVSWCDKSCISIFLDDYIEHPEIDNYVRKAKEIVKKVTKDNELGLLTDEDRISSSIKIYDYISNKVKKSLLDYYPRNNNLFIIMDSGARGSADQLAQTCGIIGVIKKNSRELLETPILSNYTRGVSSIDQSSLSFGTRDGFATIQQDVAKVGELTRASVYTLAKFEIVEHDCGLGCTPFDVMYSDSIMSCMFVYNNGDAKNIEISNILDKVISQDDENYSKLVSIGGPSITSNSLYYIRKKNIRSIKFSNGTVYIKYRLSELFRSLALHRISEDLPYLSDGLNINGSTNGAITQRTLDYIEENNLPSINMRTMLTCSSSGGVCAKCYGLKEDNHKYPKVGEMIGVTAAQAIGESVTQCQLDQINSGGKGSQLRGADVLKQYCKGSVPSSEDKCSFAPSSCYVSVKDMGKDLCAVKFTSGKDVEVNKQLLLVKDGEFVDKGDKVSEGMLDPNLLVRDTMDDTIRSRQLELISLFNKLFSDSGVDIIIRNFEALVRAQTSLVRVYKSDDTNIPAGSIAYLSDVLKSKGSIGYTSNVEPSKVIISKYSGFLTSISFGNAMSAVAESALTPWVKYNNSTSFIGQLAIGEDVSTGEKKELVRNNYKNVDAAESSYLNSVKLRGENLGKFITESSKSVKPISEEISFDLSDLFNDESFSNSLEESNRFSDQIPKEEVKEESVKLHSNDAENSDVSIESSSQFGSFSDGDFDEL